MGEVREVKTNKPGGWRCPLCAYEVSTAMLDYYGVAPQIKEPLYIGYEGPDHGEIRLWLLGTWLFGVFSGFYIALI